MNRTFTRVLSPLFGWDPESIQIIRRNIDRLLTHQKRQEETMATSQEVLDSGLREIRETLVEISETLTSVQGAVAFIQGVPALVRKAVEDAIAANPAVDLTGLSQVANELDAQQAKLDEAQLAIGAAISAAQATPDLPLPTPTPPVTE